MLHRPCFAERRFRERPAPHAFFIRIAGEDSVGLIPFPLRQGWQPDCLPLRADDAIGAILFKLQPVAAVQQRIIGRRLGFKNERQALGRARARIGPDFAKRSGRFSSAGFGAALANCGRGFLKAPLPSVLLSNLFSVRGASCFLRSKPRSCLPPDGFLPFPFGVFTRNSNHPDCSLGRIKNASGEGENA